MKINEDTIYKAFLRGYFDADGCVYFERNPREKYAEFKKTHHYYPRVTLSSVSKDLIKDIEQILKTTGFRFYIREWVPLKPREHKNYVITTAGSEQLKIWMKEIGSSNPVHISKYEVWKRFGFCPPRTTLKQRLMMLSGELDPEIFYGNRMYTW